MKNKSKTILIILVMISLTAKSQLAISYSPFQSLLGISTNTDKLLWLDYKIETNTFASNLNMEFSPKINFIRKTQVNYYVGAGISFNPINSGSDLTVTNGYFFDFGTRIKPFLNYKSIQILFELSPYINNQFSGGNIRTRLGVSYNFINNSKRSFTNENDK